MEIREKLLKSLNCPTTLAQNLIAGKWKILIMWHLRNEVKRFNELQKDMPEIKQAYLTKQLRELEQDELIHREVYKVVPPKVEYSLTPIGEKLLPVLVELRKWGMEYMDYINNK
ncbi:positive regulator of hxlAB expression (formaldehyde sensing) [Tepidibacter aestuarii]|uniref:winged helix-turn-helix transcriptional regulator n=1 Tax=Tepidibacter aestuarii TaxID=2925782 RepID=UPI0020C00DD6|nr:helix-turn-helix domain-containing protein [Tepidibacter aestuarii]CAH2211775.1 positive regulator of hxlAB expression (formaldehyde sensing) [Tepidibacter aestuarii]